MGVIDFETTGISPGMGDRATEVAVVITEHGRVVDRFQSLMNAGVHIPSFITGLTDSLMTHSLSPPPLISCLLPSSLGKRRPHCVLFSSRRKSQEMFYQALEQFDMLPGKAAEVQTQATSHTKSLPPPIFSPVLPRTPGSVPSLQLHASVRGTQYTRFTSTQVQILTPEGSCCRCFCV